jgi:soluble lytic murein transglycosylase
MPRLIAALLSIWAACVIASANAPPPQPSATEEFVAAMRRVRTNLPEPPDSSALKDYPIYDYLIAARLRRDLAASPNEEIDSAIDGFLRAHTGQPVVQGLRHQWLASLAERRRWDWFLARSADLTDPPLICDRLAGRLATGDTDGLAADALVRWSIPQQPPQECTGVFAWLRTQGLLTPALDEARVRAALLTGNAPLAREFIADVPVQRRAPLLQWIGLLEAPQENLDRLATTPTLPVEPEALVAGFTRLARADSAAASDLLPPLMARPDMGPMLQAQLRRAAALGAALARQPGAVTAFSQLSGDSIDTPVQEWRVRAALWAGDYDKALEWIEQMPASLATQPRWRYWRARAVAATRGSEAAAELFAEIAGTRDYYGYLAADHLHLGYELNIRPSSNDQAAQTALAMEPGMIRAHALIDCGMVDEAGAEWSATLATAKPAMKVQAAHLASRWGWYTQTIATLAQADEWADVPLRYPRPYVSEIANASKLTRVPADWILAVMRQESLFRKDAVSRADACGLMQMLPATAALVARRWHLPAPHRDDLFDPAIAVPLGAAYVRELLDRYGDQLSLGLAAYNAGPSAVARWMPHRTIEADIWIENIPFTETRSYVEHVLEHIVAFAVVRDAAPPRLSALLPPITPFSPDRPTVTTRGPFDAAVATRSTLTSAALPD